MGTLWKQTLVNSVVKRVPLAIVLKNAQHVQLNMNWLNQSVLNAKVISILRATHVLTVELTAYLVTLDLINASCVVRTQSCLQIGLVAAKMDSSLTRANRFARNAMIHVKLALAWLNATLVHLVKVKEKLFVLTANLTNISQEIYA